MAGKLDKKDYEILRELDLNYRQSLSRIAKKVRLSKNSVSLKFEKLKPYISHASTAINQEALGYTQLRIFYSFDFYDSILENTLLERIKDFPDVYWASRLFGRYDFCLCLLVPDFSTYISLITSFNEGLEDRIKEKELQVVEKERHNRNNFIHDDPISLHTRELKNYNLVPAAKKVLLEILEDPRVQLTTIAERTGMTVKTVSTHIKNMERSGFIQGYFITLLPMKFGLVTFKMLLQVREHKIKFEKRLRNLINTRLMCREIGMWDYEIDFLYPNIMKLEADLEKLNVEFPRMFKKIEILSFSRKLYKNSKGYLQADL